ncbi:MAG: AMP-binding protein [Actinobacteria bacterium]|nr:AMP-binding protein [Actinomycetota bacterium]
MTTVWDAVAAQACRSPRAIAIVAAERLSYQEMLDRAAELATLIEPCAPAGSLLALQAVTPAAGAITMLAAARANCAILPLSADSPVLHRDFVLRDARPTLLIAERGDGTFAVSLPDTGLPPAVGLDGVAYVMYTSGSTGRPKGVVVSQLALLDRLTGMAQRPGLGPDESILAMTALSFDISMAELLLPLIVGGRFVSARPQARLDPAIFAREVATYAPDVIQATPSFWRLALAWGWNGAPGARLWCGGEPLTASLARRLLATGQELWNLYGPTEATIWSTADLVTDADRIGLGEPIPGTGVCLAVGDREIITEPGRPGEIWLYGAGLAEGYLERPELTAARFGVRPTPDGPARCYLTGDRARYRAGGGLEFLGRTDGQVKLRGHRVELGELENVLEEHARIYQAVAVLREADVPERAHIAAFLVTDGSLTTREIRRWLAERLPTALRPKHLEILSSIPRTTAGKADRTKLAAMPSPNDG